MAAEPTSVVGAPGLVEASLDSVVAGPGSVAEAVTTAGDTTADASLVMALEHLAWGWAWDT